MHPIDELLGAREGEFIQLKNEEIDTFIEDVATAIKLKNEASLIGHLPAGVTYLGQMIAHEIVSSTSTENRITVSPLITMGSLYGHSSAYESSLFDKEGKFHLGFTLTNGSKQLGQDLQRNEIDGTACIGDQRNDENLIISQLHLLWLRFHNKLVEDELSEILDREERILKAKEWVTYAFQLVVIEDFLNKVLDPLIFDLYCKKHNSYILREGNSFDLVPKLFSHAIFRFGHSMIREHYAIQNKIDKRVPIEELFRRRSTKNKQRWVPSNDSIVINWQMFFGTKTNESLAQRAARIDTEIVVGMENAPLGGVTKHIIKVNLSAGMKEKLPTGFGILAKIQTKFPRLYKDAKLGSYKHPILSPKLQNLKETKYSELLSNNNLPLWLFTLEEAKNSQFGGIGGGNRLGRIASIIVAEVIMNSIRCSPSSIVESAKESKGELNNLLSIFGKETDDNEQLGIDSSRSKIELLKMLDIIEYVENETKVR